MTVDEVESAIANYIKKNRKTYPKGFYAYDEDGVPNSDGNIDDCVRDGRTQGYSEALTDLAFQFGIEE